MEQKLEKQKAQRKVIYLLQMKMMYNGKPRIFKYVGQTVDFEARKKAHIRDLRSKTRTSKQRALCNWMRRENSNNREEYYDSYWESIQKSQQMIWDCLDKGDYSFSIIHEVNTGDADKDKQELNCAEYAYMWMLEPQLNSFWSEANCHDINCNICKHYGLWGNPNSVDFPAKWHWPTKDFFSSNAMANARRKHLRTNIKQNRSQITYEKKWKTGWLPNDVKRLWNEKDGE